VTGHEVAASPHARHGREHAGCDRPQ
jgi:hypothetical protein